MARSSDQFRIAIPVATKFNQSGLAKSETGLVKRNGASLDRCLLLLTSSPGRVGYIS